MTRSPYSGRQPFVTGGTPLVAVALSTWLLLAAASSQRLMWAAAAGLPIVSVAAVELVARVARRRRHPESASIAELDALFRAPAIADSARNTRHIPEEA